LACLKSSLRKGLNKNQLPKACKKMFQIICQGEGWDSETRQKGEEL
jgi:hypothetical protein